MQSTARNIREYLDTLPVDRRKEIEAVRGVILEHLPSGYEESVEWGMIAYQVPLSEYPGTYNKRPLMYAALASQKNYLSLYLLGVYGSEELRAELDAAFLAAGKKQDMGKSCIRFRSASELPLDAIGAIVAKVSMKEYIECAKSIRRKG